MGGSDLRCRVTRLVLRLIEAFGRRRRGWGRNNHRWARMPGQTGEKPADAGEQKEAIGWSGDLGDGMVRSRDWRFSGGFLADRHWPPKV